MKLILILFLTPLFAEEQIYLKVLKDLQYKSSPVWVEKTILESKSEYNKSDGLKRSLYNLVFFYQSINSFAPFVDKAYPVEIQDHWNTVKISYDLKVLSWIRKWGNLPYRDDKEYPGLIFYDSSTLKRDKVSSLKLICPKMINILCPKEWVREFYDETNQITENMKTIKQNAENTWQILWRRLPSGEFVNRREINDFLKLHKKKIQSSKLWSDQDFLSRFWEVAPIETDTAISRVSTGGELWTAIDKRDPSLINTASRNIGLEMWKSLKGEIRKIVIDKIVPNRSQFTDQQVRDFFIRSEVWRDKDFLRRFLQEELVNTQDLMKVKNSLRPPGPFTEKIKSNSRQIQNEIRDQNFKELMPKSPIGYLAPIIKDSYILDYILHEGSFINRYRSLEIEMKKIKNFVHKFVKESTLKNKNKFLSTINKAKIFSHTEISSLDSFNSNQNQWHEIDIKENLIEIHPLQVLSNYQGVKIFNIFYYIVKTNIHFLRKITSKLTSVPISLLVL